MDAEANMESPFEIQRVTTTAAINIPLNPAASRYLGKTYTMSLPAANSPAANNSTITLAAGSFVGQGVPAGVQLTARFLGANSSITFVVESTNTVRVLQSLNMAYP